jgi:hypothetical protein
MNKFKNIISLALLVCSSSIIAANEASTLLMSQTKAGYSIDFLNNDGVTGLQFDVSLSGAKMNDSALKSCVSGLPKTHTGSCSLLKNGDVRVIVFSTSNAILDSGSIGNINLSVNTVDNVSINKVLMGTPDMTAIKGDVLIDIDYKKPANEDLDK